MTATPSLSVRLSEDIRARLDEAARHTNRSRSVLVQEALTRHLADIVAEHTGSRQKRLDTLRALKGAGARMHGPRSADDIEAQIRAFRGGDE